MTQEQIKDVLDKHKKWLYNEYGGEKANLRGSDLSKANLRWADLRLVDLREANLRLADLSLADLREADLRLADLREANLRLADLSGANLNNANLNNANLSGADGLLFGSEWMPKNFECDDKGYVVYRAQNGNNKHPDHWVFEPGKFLTEIPNHDRCTMCGCGVSFATLKWVKENYEPPYWRCRINWKDLLDTVIPYDTDGKGRCARLELLEIVEE